MLGAWLRKQLAFFGTIGAALVTKDNTFDGPKGMGAMRSTVTYMDLEPGRDQASLNRIVKRQCQALRGEPTLEALRRGANTAAAI